MSNLVEQQNRFSHDMTQSSEPHHEKIGFSHIPKQIRSKVIANQCPCFRFTDSTIPSFLESNISSFWPFSETVQADLLELGGNSEDWFSRDVAHRL